MFQNECLTLKIEKRRKKLKVAAIDVKILEENLG